MYKCFDTAGKRITRVGVSSIKRVLKDLYPLTDGGENCWATVSCPDAGVYISRFDSIYEVSWISDGSDLYDAAYRNQKTAINNFLELRKEATEVE